MVVPCALDDGVPDYNQHEWHISQKTRKKHYRNAVVEQHKQQVIAWEDLTDALKKDKSRRDWSWLLIDPRSSAAIRTWDLITSTALIFTAVVTPFEVGFIDLPKERWTDPLFLANRVVDLIFISDMVMQFFLMYPTTDIKDPAGERWVADHGRIARRYLTSAWFLVDLVSVGVAGFDIFSPTSGPLAKFKGFRAIRVLRLVKLVKLVNASRIFKRWEMRLSINYAKLSIAQVLIGLVFCCHLFGCVWGLQASFDPLNTWPGAKEYCVPWQSATCPDGKVCSADTSTACEQPGSMYLYSVYWAIATVTSIGYGDVAASAFNEVEQLICTIIMLAGAIFFANIVGQFCGLAASLAPEKVQFRYDLSDLNYHMHEEAIPDELRYRLREYFHNTIHLRQGKIRVRLLKLLSPGLAGEFALKMNERWLTDVWFLDGVHCRELQVQIALELRAHVFPHNEIVPLGSMYIVSGRGRALYAGHVLKLGQAFRTDELVAADGLRATYPAIALSYLWTYAITGVKLRELLANCPKAARDVIMRRQMSLTLRRAIVRAAEEECMRLGKMFYGRPHFIYARDTKEVPAHAHHMQSHARYALGMGMDIGMDWTWAYDVTDRAHVCARHTWPHVPTYKQACA